MNLKIKKRTMLVLVAVLVFASVFTACSSGSGEAVEQVLKINETYTEDGAFFYKDGLLYYADRASGAVVPVCDKPNCEHQSHSGRNPAPTCSAAFAGSLWNVIAAHNDKLYFVGLAGASASFNHYAVFETDLNGSNRRTVAEFENLQAIDSAAYFAPYLLIAYSNQYDLETGGMDASELWTCGVIAVNLDTGAVDYLPSRKDYPSPTYNITLFDNKIYYTYALADGYYLAADLPTDPDEYAAFMQEHTENIVQCYDLETKTETEYLASDANFFFADGVGVIAIDFFANPTTVSLHDFTTGETEKLFDIGKDFSYNLFDAEENRILYSTSGEENGENGNTSYYYDLNTRKHVKISDFMPYSSANSFYIHAVLEDTVYINFTEAETGEYSLGYIDKDDYYNGDFDKKVFLRYHNK